MPQKRSLNKRGFRFQAASGRVFCTLEQSLNYQSHRAFFDMVPFMGRWVQK
jgi:hypothetical protein